MSWRSNPNPLTALRRVVELDGEEHTPPDTAHVRVATATALATRPAPARPAPDPLRKERPASDLITTTPSPHVVEAPEPPAVDPLLKSAPPMTIRQVGVALLVCLALWGLVDSPALARTAAASPFGTRRTAALDVLRPVARVDSFLGLDRVDRAARSLLHRSQPAPVDVSAPDVRPPVSSPAAVANRAATLRVPTAAAPLRVLVIGDSIGLSFGQSLAGKLDATGLTTTTVDARDATGLARPDAFDWPQQLRADIVRFHPEVVVASFGGNDDQDLNVGGSDVPFGTPRWTADYEARVVQIADAARSGNAFFAFSGLPVMRSAAKTARYQVVMDAVHTALAGQPKALFVDNISTLADANGHYAVALQDANGTQVLVRQPDGIHETPAGADRVAAAMIAAMEKDFGLRI